MGLRTLVIEPGKHGAPLESHHRGSCFGGLGGLARGLSNGPARKTAGARKVACCEGLHMAEPSNRGGGKKTVWLLSSHPRMEPPKVASPLLTCCQVEADRRFPRH